MATKRQKDSAEKRSVSAPKSLWNATEKLLQRQMPRVPLSRHLQQLMARDLREHGLLGTNGSSEEAAHAS